MSARQISRSLLVILVLGFVFVVGCSESTDPSTGGDTDTANIDTGNGTFVLKSVDLTDRTGRDIRVQLLGTDLVLDDDGQHVELTVAVRNPMAIAISAPLTLWLHSFNPISVFVANPDTSLPVGSVIPVDGFIYNTEFGRDLVLEAGETSVAKTWRFRTQDQGSFAFGIRGESGTPAGKSVITGECFWDDNRNGVRDDDEDALAPSLVSVIAPSRKLTVVTVNPDGWYSYPLAEEGLHRVSFDPQIHTIIPLAYSAPNPREVLITRGPDGTLNPARGVNFGAYTDVPLGPPEVRFTNAPLDSLQPGSWSLIELEMSEDGVLICEVGYSGCQPRHRFTLWTDGAFMESMPVQVNVALVNETVELCDAYWTGEYPFSLAPLGRKFMEAYGPGELQVNLIGFGLQNRTVTWQVGQD